MSPDLKQFELDRITNMLKSFSWEVVTSRFEGDKILVQYQKDLKGPPRTSRNLSLTGLQICSGLSGGLRCRVRISRIK